MTTQTELGSRLFTAMLAARARVAAQLGLSATDHHCAELVVHAGRPLTAGEIAALSGLSTGAITGVVDRLERAGYVRRIRDEHDRRRVLVEVTPVKGAQLRRAMNVLDTTVAQTLSGYSDADRARLEHCLTAWIRAL
ncbi:MarR family winged helix-turn-helix transcriptional regulator [Kibdelosporangium phytohabitans]|nr:MarR family transcriptional regulator [Kibdelosporangium phytohabitans]MBE1462087.1 DNA-binding MarR family transcriptional regulator [Kibdelosporangium phytohabitans]